MIDLSSAGISVKYAVESRAGAMPTSGFTKIPSIKAIPDINPEPAGLDATTFDDLEWKRYIPGLKDPGSSLPFTANNNEAFQTAWETLVEAAQTGAQTGLATWFAIIIPGLTKAFMFSGDPAPLGLSGVEVDSVVSVDAYITPTAIAGWTAKPTDKPTVGS